jgi:flagellar hook-basal body complex protein FliE
MSRAVRILALLPMLVVFLLAAACGDPPEKELHEAQGAIDAARAAGAEKYAADELKAAQDALDHAQTAVGDRDYRLALNYALDSRERAQNAAKTAADQKAATRSDAERLLAEVTTAIAIANGKLQAAQAAHQPPSATEPLATALAAARQATDDAGKALASQDYIEAKAHLEGVAASLTAVAQRVPRGEAPLPPRSPKRPR